MRRIGPSAEPEWMASSSIEPIMRRVATSSLTSVGSAVGLSQTVSVTSQTPLVRALAVFSLPSSLSRAGRSGEVCAAAPC